MASSNIWLVIPTIRDLTFLSEWGNAFCECHLLIIEDRDKSTVSLPHHNFKSIHHYNWMDIKQDFGENEWIFSRRNAGIRSYGFWKAWKAGAEIIITLDDDCFPVGDPQLFVANHVHNLHSRVPKKWFATYPDPQWMFTRGFPYNIRNEYPVKISHGIWSGALDLDGKTEILLPQLLKEKAYPPIRQMIPFGYYYPMCSMNLAFHKEVTPLMFFPMMGMKPDGEPWGYDRYDDIWAGILSKKVMDHLGWGVINGSPQVEHRKASIVKTNVEKEQTGLTANEDLWKLVDEVELISTSPISCYEELIMKLRWPNDTYFLTLQRAMLIWANSF